MCNRYGYNNPLKRLIDEFSSVGTIHWNGLEPNAPLDQIRPTDRAPIIRSLEGEMTLDMVRWGIIPSTWRGPIKAWTAQLRGNPLTNARSETVSATSTFRDGYAARRCLVPATNYFEWTTDPERPKGKKLTWQFKVSSQPVFAFPGIWDHADTVDGPIDSFTLLTSAPGPDQAPFHTRQPVILERAQWSEWLDVSNDLARTFKGSPAGAINVEKYDADAAQGAADRAATLF